MKKRGAKKRQYELWEGQKAIEAEYSQRYRERNPDAAKSAQKRYRESHREEINQRRRDHYHKDLTASRKANREKGRQWRATVQGGFHRYHLNRYYGPGAADHYSAQFDKQEGKCAACGCLPAGKLHLDHNHATNQFRGLLCGGCNRAIGICEENVERIRKLASYIEKWATMKEAA